MRLEKLGGERFVMLQLRQFHVFDRVAERPMAKIVQQRRDHQHFRSMRIDDGRESRIAAQLPEIFQRVEEHTQSVLEARVRRARIDLRGQAQLRDVGQPLKLRRIDDRADSRCERHIQLDRDAHETAPGFQVHQLRNVAVRVRHDRTEFAVSVGEPQAATKMPT